MNAEHSDRAVFRVTLLGTGNPYPSPERFGPSALVEAGGQRLLVDAGRGVPGMQIPTFVERLRRAGFDPVPLDPQNAAANRSAGGFFSYLLKRASAGTAATASPGLATAAGATP